MFHLRPIAYRISTPTLKNRHPPCAGVSTGVHGSTDEFFIVSDFAIRIERQLHLRFAFDQGAADTADGNARQHTGHRAAKCTGEHPAPARHGASDAAQHQPGDPSGHRARRPA